VRRDRARAADADGTEPDPRFTLANERTYLAWIRTALALIAAGVALEALAGELDDTVRRLASAALVALGMLSALAAHHRWRKVQQALRHNRALPTMRSSIALGYAVAVVGVVLIVLS